VRESRLWGLVGTMFLLAVSASPALAAGPPPLPVNYDRTIYGDFSAIGNTVTACPREPGHYPVKLCADARNRVGSGVAAQNNGHPLVWADVDDNSATFNSSSARLVIPPGARVEYAKLVWAGNTGGPAGVPCGRGAKPSGSPKDQAVSISVNGRSTVVKPARYSEDAPINLGHTDHQFYSAHADVTGQLQGISDVTTVTVGNVWTPQGFDCFGGWSLVTVWAFDERNDRYAPARKQVAVYDGHIRLVSGSFRADVRMPAVRAAGGPSRVGVGGFEGDWAVSGDQFLINGKNAGRSDNFFVSEANGRLNPDHVNNMSVDVRSVDVGPDVMAPGESGANLTFTSGLDAYLVANVAVSSARPELIADTTVDPVVVRPGDQVTQSVAVANVGAAPAVDIRVHEDLGPACDQHIAWLDPGKSARVSCTRPAREADYQPSAHVTGQSLAGDKLDVRVGTAVDVIRPAITVSKTASPTTVLSGQIVGYQVDVRNAGDSPLSDVKIDDKQVDGCDNAAVGELPVGGSKTVQCSVVAGDDGFTNAVTATANDQTRRPVTGEARAAFSVVHPRVALTVTPSSHAVRAGENVTFTVTVLNPSLVPLGNVSVSGTPAACQRSIGELAPGKSFVYTCAVTAAERFTTTLTVSATPLLNGQLVTTRRDTVRGNVSLVVSVVPAVVAPPPVARKSMSIPAPPPPPMVVVIAGLAAVSTFVTVGAISATARPRK
jgi:uncharacterized repeat protein (TIGR01451 family)